jgi:hypothetical protein
MFSNPTQAAQWTKAEVFGGRSREKLATFNDAKLAGPTHAIRFGRVCKLSAYVSRRSIGVVFSDPDGSTSVEQMGAWLASMGLGYDAALGAVPAAEPAATPVPRTMNAEPAAPAKPAKLDDGETQAIAKAYARFGQAPAFRRAFTAAGKLRKGWILINGAPCWSEAVSDIRSQGLVRF